MSVTKWIVLRGLGRGHGHWGTFIPKLAAACSKDKIYWLDLPGNGFLNKVKSPAKIQDYISILENQLQATDFFQTEGRCVGVGLSLGAMVLTEWSQQQPLRFSKLLLINTSAANFSKPWKRISLRVFANSLRQLFTSELEHFEMNSLRVTTTLTEDSIRTNYNDSYLAVIQFSKNYPVKKNNIIRQLFAAARYKFPKKIAAPTILIRGAGDKFVNPQCSQDIQRHWGCDLVTHPNAGHDIAFEDSDWLIRTLKANSL